MGYSKTTWVTGTTPISAANLNNLETQYDEVKSELASGSDLTHGASAHTNITRTIDRPFMIADGGEARGRTTEMGFVYLESGEAGYAIFQMPADFVSFVSAKVILEPNGTGTFDWACGACRAEPGQTLSYDADSTSGNDQACTDNTILEITISAALDGLTLSAGKWVGVQFSVSDFSSVSGIGAIGVSISYTANQ